MQNKGMLAARLGVAALVLTGIGVAVGLGVSSLTRVGAAGFPASKAAVAIDNLISLSAAATVPATPGDTDWVDVLRTQIKTSSQKDLAFDVALQCGIVTDTTVKSTGGQTSSATARANISVRVWVNDELASPFNGGADANGPRDAAAEGIVYCDRIQTLNAKFAGLNCTAGAGGVVTCTTPEELELILKTLDANAFNFAKADVGVGVHTITVQARAQANVAFDAISGALSGAQAFTGAGSMLVEEVRLVKDANIIIDIQ